MKELGEHTPHFSLLLNFLIQHTDNCLPIRLIMVQLYEVRNCHRHLAWSTMLISLNPFSLFPKGS